MIQPGMSRGYKYDVWDAENFDDIHMDAKDFIPQNFWSASVEAEVRVGNLRCCWMSGNWKVFTSSWRE
jgi:hypothetical protein